MSVEDIITGAAAKALLYAPTDALARAAYEIGLLRGVLREQCAELGCFTDGPGRAYESRAVVNADDGYAL